MSRFSVPAQSSKEFREFLKREYCEVPAATNDIPISKYFQLAKMFHLEASREGVGLDQSYIFYQRFLSLSVAQLPKHNAYRSKASEKERLWLERESRKALEVLEKDVVPRMDLKEQERLEKLIDEALIDEFDGDFDSDKIIDFKMTSAESSEIVDKTMSVSISRRLDILKIDDTKASSSPSSSSSSYPSIPSYSLDNFKSDDDSTECAANPSVISQMSESITILRFLREAGKIYNFFAPHPSLSILEILIGQQHQAFRLRREDYHVSFHVFLQGLLPPELQISFSATETNRCFWLHLGIATNIHPFALQTAYRYLAMERLNVLSLGIDDSKEVEREILSSIVTFAGFVDAHILCFLWPIEFHNHHFCFVSGPTSKPIFSSFASRGASSSNLHEVLIHCDGQHFTLCTPLPATSRPFLENLLKNAKSQGLVVHENTVETTHKNPSISKVLGLLQQRGQ